MARRTTRRASTRKAAPRKATRRVSRSRNSGRGSFQRSTKRVSGRRSSAGGGIIKLVIQHAPAVASVNPTEKQPLMSPKPTEAPKKAKF